MLTLNLSLRHKAEKLQFYLILNINQVDIWSHSHKQSPHQQETPNKGKEIKPNAQYLKIKQNWNLILWIAIFVIISSQN